MVCEISCKKQQSKNCREDLLPVFESVSPHVYNWKLVTLICATSFLKERLFSYSVFVLCVFLSSRYCCKIANSACKNTGEFLDARIYEVLWSEGDGCGKRGGGVPFGS